MTTHIQSKLSKHNGVFSANSILKDARALLDQGRKAGACGLLRDNLPKDTELREIKAFADNNLRDVK